MNLSPSESDSKRFRKTKPRVGVIFRSDDEYSLYVADFNDEKMEDPPIRINPDDMRSPSHGMCLLGSTLFIFATATGDSTEYENLDDESRRCFKGARSVFAADLSLNLSPLTQRHMRTLPDLLWPKNSPVAIPSPKKNGDILVFSKTLISTPIYESSTSYSDFELYNPFTGTRRALPGLYRFIMKMQSRRIFNIGSYAFLDNRTFFVKVEDLILTIDLEDQGQDWQPYETPVLVYNWGQFHRFHDFWLTEEGGFYLLREGPKLTKGFYRPDFPDYGDGDGDGDGGGDDDDYRDFGLPFSSELDVHLNPSHPHSTLIGDLSFCTVRSGLKMRTGGFPQIMVDLFEFDLDKLRNGELGGCKLVSSLELNSSKFYRRFYPIALCAIDEFPNLKSLV